MKPRVKNLMAELEALGFERKPHPTKPGWIYWHANDAAEELKVYPTQMAENACRLLSKRAHKIADLGTSGPAESLSLRDRLRFERAEEKARRDAHLKGLNERAAAAEREHQVRARAAAAARRESEIRGLMQPGYGR